MILEVKRRHRRAQGARVTTAAASARGGAFARLTTRQAPRMVASVARRKISTTVYLTPEQDRQLKELHARTKVPVAEYIRQGIDLILEKHRAAAALPWLSPPWRTDEPR